MVQSRVSTILFTAAAFVVVIAGMKAAEAIVVPFILSVFIAIISIPLLFWLESKGLNRGLAMLIVIAALCAVIMGIIFLAGSSIRELSQNLPLYRERINAQALPLMDWLRGKGVNIPTSEYMQYFEPGTAIQLFADLLNGLGKTLSNAFLILLTTVFILFEASSFPHKLQAIFPNPDTALKQFATFRDKIRHYLVIKTFASLATGATIGIGLAIIGVNYFVLWGLLAFFFNYVPNVGSIIAAVPTVLFTMVQLGVAPALWVLFIYILINVVIGSLIEPRFMGRGLGLSVLAVFLSLVFWGWVLGPVGMFLSVPLTIMFKIALDSHPETRWIALCLGPGKALEGFPQIAIEQEMGKRLYL